MLFRSSDEPSEEPSEAAVETAKPTEAPRQTAAPAVNTPAPMVNTPAPATPAPTPQPTPQPTPAPTPEPTPAPPPAATKEAAVAYIGRSAASMIAAIGQPISSSYASSCMGDGEDGELIYSGFTVYTYRDASGEVVQDVI